MSLILVTGMPGTGKTTIIRKLSEELRARGLSVAGFYTEEVRNSATGGGERSGFDVVTFTGQRAPLARVGTRPGTASGNPSVGRYIVCLAEFEALALPTLDERHRARVLIVDEIGKMELKSRRFSERMDAILKEVKAGTVRFIATVPLKANGIQLIEMLKAVSGCQLFHVKPSNREDIYADLLSASLRLTSA
ncbi:cancer-related nucleoside-triphosphatase [Anopheles aquasalis]|uniref:cancer-related nucleoside-triphosphatase n=1 Tax=Anopheles aquasalis TaxID=42839 RepID=UPI00215ACB69|nr:cancer-related nucleoside-triphosphatase [Anopheles aquasalis]